MMAGVEEEEEEQALAVENLRSELDEERHAASSGADEALAMILRLQVEKATERMEAEQFRRMAEERILHDADSLAFLRAVVFHQEMDIASLNLRLMAAATNVVAVRRNASLPATARLEELDDDGGDNNSSRTRLVVASPREIIISEEEDGGDGQTIAELGAAVRQIKGTVQNLATEISESRESSVVAGARMLAEISAKLDAIAMNKSHNAAAGGGEERKWSSREEGSSSKGKSVVVSLQQSELLMNLFIEAMMYIA